MFEIIPLLVLAFASYRITRFLIIDTLPEGLRVAWHNFLIGRVEKNGKLKLVWQKLYELTSCTWCAGFWVSFLLYWVFAWTSPVDFTRFDWISVFAIAGLQGLLNAWEPDDE